VRDFTKMIPLPESERMMARDRRRIWIPSLGDKLILKSDWTFALHCEQRNKSLMKYFEMPVTGFSCMVGEPKIVTLPKGTILKVDRIFIRQGAEGYNSVTFRWSASKCRFWVKLYDVNKMEAAKYEERSWEL
jgi:hypothetical protein